MRKRNSAFDARSQPSLHVRSNLVALHKARLSSEAHNTRGNSILIAFAAIRVNMRGPAQPWAGKLVKAGPDTEGKGNCSSMFQVRNIRVSCEPKNAH